MVKRGRVLVQCYNAMQHTDLKSKVICVQRKFSKPYFSTIVCPWSKLLTINYARSKKVTNVSTRPYKFVYYLFNNFDTFTTRADILIF